MKQYTNDNFAIAGDMVLAYNGNHPMLKVPGRFADITVSRIGDGAFMESSCLQCIVLPPQIKQIGCKAFLQCPSLTSVFLPGGLTAVEANAFGGCKCLKDITVYGLELTFDEYHSLKQAGNRSSEGSYILREMPKHDLIQKIISSIPEVKPACSIPANLSALFDLAADVEPLFHFSFDKNLPTIGFDTPSVPRSELQTFLEHIRRKKPETYDEKAEQMNDWYVRVEKTPPKQRTIIFTFDDTKTKEENGKFFIHATLKIGYFFWQSAQPVVYNGKQYYIYRRHFLSDDPQLRYTRHDIAVCTEKGLVEDRTEAQNVHAKYKLLSIL